MWDWRQLNWFYYFGWWDNFSKTERARRFIRYYGIFLFLFDFLQLIPELMGLYTEINEGSLKGAIVNLTTTLLGLICAIKAYTLLFHGDKVRALIELLRVTDLAPVPKLLGNEAKTIMDSAEKRCKFCLYIVIPISASLLHWIFRPCILFFAFDNRTTIINVYVPWDLQTIYGWAAVYFIQIVHVSTAVFGLIFFDCLIICMGEMILAQFYILNRALITINFTNTRLLRFREDARKNIYKVLTIDVCVDYHRNLLRVVDLFRQLTDDVQIAQFIILTIVFCLSTFEASSLKGVTVNKLLNLIELLLSFTYFKIMYCYYSATIAYQCQEVGRLAYMSNWYEANKSEKNCLMMIVERSKQREIFGKFVDVDLNTFVTVFKSAFSYYNVLKAFDIS